MEKCPQCDGFGKIFAVGKPIVMDCDMCSATGLIDDKKTVWIKQGALLKEKRLKMKIGLREAAERFGLDPGNLSKMERGIIKPMNYFNKAK